MLYGSLGEFSSGPCLHKSEAKLPLSKQETLYSFPLAGELFIAMIPIISLQMTNVKAPYTMTRTSFRESFGEIDYYIKCGIFQAQCSTTLEIGMMCCASEKC